MSTSDPAGILALLAVIVFALGCLVVGLAGRAAAAAFFVLAACAAVARLLVVSPSFVTVLVGCVGLLAALLTARPREGAALEQALCAFCIGTCIPHFAPYLAEVLSRVSVQLPEMSNQIVPNSSTAALIVFSGFLGAGIGPNRLGALVAIFGALLAWPFRDPLSTAPFPIAASLSFFLLLGLATAQSKRPIGEEPVK